MFQNKYLNIAALSVSAIAYAAAWLTENWILFLIGLPCFLNLIILVHECGHAVFCRLNGNTVTSIKIPFLTVEKGSVQINTKPDFNSYCAFIRSKDDALVYVGGPLFSLFLSFALFALWVLTAHFTALLSTLVALLHFLKNLIPLGGSDARMLAVELKKRRTSGR